MPNPSTSLKIFILSVETFSFESWWVKTQSFCAPPVPVAHCRNAPSACRVSGCRRHAGCRRWHFWTNIRCLLFSKSCCSLIIAVSVLNSFSSLISMISSFYKIKEYYIIIVSTFRYIFMFESSRKGNKNLRQLVAQVKRVVNFFLIVFYFVMQNTAYNGTALMWLSKPKCFMEILIE